ncbi:MAG: hypothetical protein ACKVKV_04635 [Dehalococcoidia bacterium]
MSFRLDDHYTWKAFLTFLMIGIPGILIQMIATWFVGSWSWGQEDNRPDAVMMGWVSMVRGLAGLWVQFAVISSLSSSTPRAQLLKFRRIFRSPMLANLSK